MKNPKIEINTIGERRIFSIDIGEMSVTKAKKYIEEFINEIKLKKQK